MAARAGVAPRRVEASARLFGTRQRRPRPEWIAEQAGRTVGPLILQQNGLVVYRATREEARTAGTELQHSLDPYFATPVEIVTEWWNSELGVWQDADLAGADRAMLQTRDWEVRLRCANRRTARLSAEQIRNRGEVMVGWRRRRLIVAVEDPGLAKDVAMQLGSPLTTPYRVRKLTRLRRWRFRQFSLYDRRVARSLSGVGWLVWSKGDD